MRYTDPIIKTDAGYFFCIQGMDFGPFLTRTEAESCYKKARDYYDEKENTDE